MERRDKGGQCPGRRINEGSAESPNNDANTLFSTLHLLPKDLRFKHGGGKLVFCTPGLHLTSLRL